MKKIYLIIKREYIVQIRQKSFIITTLFAPIFIFVLLYFYSNFNKKSSIEYSYKVAVVNKEFTNLSLQKNIKFIYLNKSINDINIIKLSKNFDALLYQNNIKNTYTLYILNNTYYKNLLYDNIKLLIDKLIKYKNFNIDNKNIDNINLKLKFISRNFIEYKMLIIIIMMYTLMMFIIIYSVKIMRSILEEKNSRVVEILISSVKPYQLMIGKIFGNAAVALTQFIFWILSSFIIFSILKNIISNKINFLEKNIPEINGIIYFLFNKEYIFIIIIFILYFLGGYLIFSSIFSAIASSIEIDSDYQQYSIIASIILIISFYFGIYALENPNSILVLFLSIFPISSPIIMLSRMYHYVPIWQIIISILVLFLSIVKIIKISSVIYSNNILNFNKKKYIKNIK